MNKIISYVKLIKYLKTKTPPLSIQLNITNKCKCKCVMCKKYLWNLGHMDFNKIKRIINDLHELGTETVLLSGGDPILHPHIIDIIDIISKNNMAIGILTVGNFPVSERIWNFILKNVSFLRFSVDTINEEKYKQVRGTTTLRHVLTNLHTISNLIRKYRYSIDKVRLNFTKVKGFNEDDEKEVEQFAKELGVGFKSHHVNTFPELSCKFEVEKSVIECIVPYAFALIEVDGFVYPCCVLMNENNYYDKVRKDLALGNLNEYNWDFKRFWFDNKVNKKKILASKAVYDECKTCPPRYYSSNLEYVKYKNFELFL
ncbi:MAG: radical SAM protein [Promethearchaeota archaeon]